MSSPGWRRGCAPSWSSPGQPSADEVERFPYRPSMVVNSIADVVELVGKLARGGRDLARALRWRHSLSARSCPPLCGCLATGKAVVPESASLAVPSQDVADLLDRSKMANPVRRARLNRTSRQGAGNRDIGEAGQPAQTTTFEVPAGRGGRFVTALTCWPMLCEPQPRARRSVQRHSNAPRPASFVVIRRAGNTWLPNLI